MVKMLAIDVARRLVIHAVVGLTAVVILSGLPLITLIPAAVALAVTVGVLPQEERS